MDVLAGKRFGVVLADPPWKYRNWTDAKNGAAVSAMECMSIDSMKKLPINRYAKDDSILVMWSCRPKLVEALELIEAWGFEYTTSAPWVKTIPTKGTISTGVGFWFQGSTEDILIAKRGNPKTVRFAVPGILEGYPETFYAPKGSIHSEKPIELHAWIERKCKGPYLEIFARRQTSGWTCVGLDLGTRIGPGGVEHVSTEEDRFRSGIR